FKATRNVVIIDAAAALDRLDGQCTIKERFMGAVYHCPHVVRETLVPRRMRFAKYSKLCLDFFAI
ncbi:MAG: hypothetical protein ACREON_01025, partial [Gemmatimonadaceae bacterium]